MGTTPVESVRLQIKSRLRDHLLAVDLGIGNELIALLGRDGAGKTEILRSVAGVYTPEDGTIHIQGRTVFDAQSGLNIPPVDRHVGWVPHISSLFPQQTVAENIAFPFKRGYPMPEHEAARRIDEIIDLLDLSSVRNRYLADIDDRRKHAVALGRAVILDPDILLLDQPYHDFEVSLQRKVRHDLQHLRRWIGIPALFATSDLEEAYEIADQIALLDGGRILQVAPPRTLVTRPANRNVAELVRSVNVFPGEVIEAFDDGVAVETTLGTLHVLGVRAPLGPVEVVIRPEHIRILPVGEHLPRDDNVLTGELIDDTDYGPLHSLTFHPAGAGPGDVLEISVNDLAFRQLELDGLGERRVVLPARAVHIMIPNEPGHERAEWIDVEADTGEDEVKL
ncbi:MAG: ABC transporter ATP-binding protein [Chloroflexota bacterium]